MAITCSGQARCHSRRQALQPAVVRGSRQVTDVYLLGLARKMGGCLATFDRTIPLGAVVGATRGHLAIISAVAEE